jgi:hypothetical protein
MLKTRLSLWCITLVVFLCANNAPADDVISPARDRFAGETDEVPDFQRHTVPLLGKLGCNGRACHGSFQGRGGFRLSLFGYDFKLDHENLIDRVDVDDPAGSYALHKPTLQEPHEGGRRMDVGSWEYNLLQKWIAGGAQPKADDAPALVRLEVTPSEIQFSGLDQQQILRAVAVWSDGAQEDVTCLCRFQTNDETIAAVDREGLVTSGTPGDTHVVVFYDNAVVPIPVIRPVSELTGERYPLVETPTRIDELVVEKLRKLGLVPSDQCDDAEFLRRVSLDIAGTLPTASQVRQFVADQSPDKRSRKIDELLETPAYAAWWTTKFCDWTGNTESQLNNVSPRGGAVTQDWYDWINRRITANVPYDELVEGLVLATGRREAESYREYCERMSAAHREGDSAGTMEDGLIYFWGRRNFTSTEDRAIGFAYTFMGSRIQCAQCHKHPFDVWTQEDFQQFERFFARVRFSRNGSDRDEYQAMLAELGVQDKRGGEQRRAISEALAAGQTVPFPDLTISRGDNNRRRQNDKNRKEDEEPQRQTARLLGGETVDLAEIADPRTALMDWLRNDDKQLFAKAFVNRVWANYFHRGIVEPTDDLSLANPPSNQALLNHLAEGFVASGYDMKWVHREIANSVTYQRSWRPNDTNAGDERNFSRAVPRRLPAETAYDSVLVATASDERSATFATDLEGRMILRPGAARNRGNGPDYALAVFGRSTRENNCDCDRSAEASLLQTVFLRNDQDTLQMIDRGDGWVAQVTRTADNRKESAEERPNKRDDGNPQQRVRRAEAALEKARESGNEKQIDRAERNLERAQAALDEAEGDTEDTESPAVKAEPLPAADAAALIEEAYLRTVSRFPTGPEQEIAAAYLLDADDPRQGLRDLVWTLINTKEFIVNH